MSYPEERPPVEALEKFVFDVKAGKSAAVELDGKIEAIEARLDNLVQRVEFGGVPLLRHILSLRIDKKDLVILGRAILRAAELLPKLEELRGRRAIIQFAEENPEWLAATFADFSQDVNDIESIMRDDADDAEIETLTFNDTFTALFADEIVGDDLPE